LGSSGESLPEKLVRWRYKIYLVHLQFFDLCPFAKVQSSSQSMHKSPKGVGENLVGFIAISMDFSRGKKCTKGLYLYVKNLNRASQVVTSYIFHV